MFFGRPLSAGEVAALRAEWLADGVPVEHPYMDYCAWENARLIPADEPELPAASHRRTTVSERALLALR